MYMLKRLVLLLVIAQSAYSYSAPVKIAVISSYHPEFLWTSETHEGVLKALYQYGYFISETDGKDYTENNYLKSEKIEIKKWWMDSKRKNTLPEMQKEVTRIINDLNIFEPDIVLTGDDNATNYFGNYYIDSNTPLVFWGVNGSPMKYGLLDSLEKPGRNITGVYQADYIKESVYFLKNLLPHIKTITILSDDSVSSRAKVKKLSRLSESGELPVEIVGSIVTNDKKEWQQRSLEAAKYTDAFFVMNHNTLKDANGTAVDNMEIGAWYLRNINKPEISYEEHFIVEGMFAAVSDSGVKQGFQATELAIKILNGEKPADLPVTAPQRGDYVVNRERAKMLKVYSKIMNNTQIEDWIDESLALKQYPR